MNKPLLALKLMVLAWLCAANVQATIRYVKPGSASTAWQTKTNVYADLQAALTAAVYGDQIWVAAGTYKPTTGTDRNISFKLKNGVAVYGGFVGTETLLTLRNWINNPTVLSGDIGIAGTDTDNSYNVVKAVSTYSTQLDNTTRLDGVIVEKGYADITYSGGGGLHLEYANPIIANSIFRNNYALIGGAVYDAFSSSSLFTNTLFISNKAENNGGAVFTQTALTIANCNFINNRSEQDGGAVYNSFSKSKITNCIAWGNRANNASQFYGANCTYSCVEGGYSGIGNISTDPLLVDAANGDCRLNAASPCINNGLSSAVPIWLTTDIFGNARLLGTSVDMGIAEGGVTTPLVSTPVNKAVLSGATTSAILEWAWPATQPPGITGYEIELQLNGGVSQFVSTTNKTHTLSNIIPISVYNWRVRGIDGTTVKNWSPWVTFTVKHNTPLYVKPGGTGDGLSWITAMGSLQAAIDAAVYGDEIWVAAGTYKPTTTTDRSISFYLKDGVAIYGGFAGTETQLAQRNWVANPTVLSGDIGVAGTDTDNSYCVVTAVGTYDAPLDSTTRLDGVIVEKGCSKGHPTCASYNGTGVYLNYASPTIANSLFRNNNATGSGGAVHAHNSSSLFANTLFISNKAGDCGGAVYVESALTFVHCTFVNNRSEYYVGAVKCSNSIYPSTITNCIAWGNSAKENNQQIEGATCTNSCIEGGYTGTGNISNDPLFIDAPNDDFRLNATSPCIDVALNSATPTWLTSDYFGNSRLAGTTVDMGIAEGGVATPFVTTPTNKALLPGTTTSIVLGWAWPTTQPKGITGYEIELQINGSTSQWINTTNMSYTLSNILLGSINNWRVRGIDGTTLKNWSPWATFSIQHNTPLYVKPGGTGDGLSWATAMGSLQAAIDAAIYGDEIWVAAGTHKPTTTSDRNISFNLKTGVAVYGGFAGTETQLAQRDWVNNPTILSGDIGVVGHDNDNSSTVVKAIGTATAIIDNTTRLDGVVIEKGYGGWDGGGGAYLCFANPTIANTIFRNNYSVYYGGAVYAKNSNSCFANTLFLTNKADYSGGAVYAESRLDFIHCTFAKNRSESYGGAVYSKDGTTSTTIANSIIWGNSAKTDHQQLYNIICTNSCIEGGYTGAGNISDDPLFLDAINGDCRLSTESPCVNVGLSSATPTWLTTDFNQNSRLVGTSVDMGITEGGIEVPALNTPANNAVFPSATTAIDLEWSWPGTQPNGITGYEIELQLNSGASQLMTTTNMVYTIGSISPGSVNKWRVRVIDGTTYKKWTLWATFSVNHATPIHVKLGGTGNGLSWNTAMGSLQSAIDAAIYGDKIWVAAGTYKPTTTTDRTISFTLKDGVAIYGGFAGTETILAQRNWVTNPTILSGDIGVAGTDTDNSLCVVKAAGSLAAPLDNTTRLDGVIVEKGTSNSMTEEGYSNTNGGGLYLFYANPIIANSIFRNNMAQRGGAVYAENSSSIFANTLFLANKANSSGGAVYTLSPLNFTHCNFINNQSESEAGAVFSYNTTTFTNSIAWGNSSKYSFQQFRTITCTYSCVEAGYTGTGNISSNPLFVDTANGNYRLNATSPCVNKGLNSATPTWLTTDFYGNARLAGTSVDMGIAEYDVTTSYKPATLNNAKSVSVYPNPVKGNQSVDIKLTTMATNAKVRLFDARGNLKVEETIEGTDRYTFDKTNFAPGVYIMEIVEAEDKSVVKLIIQ